ncbi:peptide chain release factor H [Providencia sneebia]|uniref:Peptide chain release factor n=1 Tax=Providencia sneebia DSM 19967 TaxID=1141660 RepID=K8WM27_9GAMM|nr:peptide chain release factor [Providencia sneebia DSM 19967]
MLLQFSSAQGPEECCIAVKKALAHFLDEAKKHDVTIDLLESVPSTHGLKSALISLEGAQADILARAWSGTLQWQSQSPIRPQHKRKNWFLSVTHFTPNETPEDNEIKFEFIKSQGPGGQHVNKTCSAVRATHVATGISVKVQSERSQHANKKLAKQLIFWHLNEYQMQQAHALDKQLHNAHNQIERGNAIKIFSGKEFKRIV